VYVPKRMEDVLSAENFMNTDMAVDRAIFIVESDERLDTVSKLLIAQGCQVVTLPSGASKSARENVRRVFAGDSPNVRTLVAHERFGVAYGLPVSKVLSTGLRRIVIVEDDEVKYMQQPLTKNEIIQQMGRANRGEVDAVGSGVVFLRETDPLPNVDLLESEKFGTAIILVAMGIIPCARLTAVTTKLLPYGISRRLAMLLVNVCGLPEEVTIRYLSEDGRVPSSFMKALNVYALDRSGGLDSRESEPKGYSDWPTQKPFEVLGYEGGPEVKVPIKATGEIGAILQAIACIQARVYVPERVPVREDDPEISGPEEIKGRTRRLGAKGYVPPPVLDVKPLPALPEASGFRVEIPVSKQPSYIRRGASMFNGVFVEDLNKALTKVEVNESRDNKGRRIVTVEGPMVDGSPVILKGGGDQQFFQLPKIMWSTMLQGIELDEIFVKYFLCLLKEHCRDLAFSSAFANYGNPWLSILLTFSNPNRLGYAMQKALHEELLAFFGCLWERYVGGMQSAVHVSHELLSWWDRLINGWSGRVVRPTQSNQVKVAQSQLFKVRLYDIRAGFSNLLCIMEESGMFNARAVSEIQRILPISRPVGNRLHDVAYSGRIHSDSSKENSHSGVTRRLRERLNGTSTINGSVYTDY